MEVKVGVKRGRLEFVSGWWLKIRLVEKKWMFLS